MLQSPNDSSERRVLGQLAAEGLFFTGDFVTACATSKPQSTKRDSASRKPAPAADASNPFSICMTPTAGSRTATSEVPNALKDSRP